MKTLKMKKVMIALDYDPTAQKVAEIGFTLATAMKAEVIMMHVITEVTYYSSMAYSPIIGYTGMMAMNHVETDSVDSLTNASNHFLDKMKDHLGDKTIKTIVQKGDFAELIINTSKKENVDIIVMGSHSKKWLENILIGSVTENVLHGSDIPIFIIPTKKR